VKKSTKIILVVLAAVVLIPALAVVIIIACLGGFSDAPPPDDADLRITYLDIPDEDNAVTYFTQAAEKLYWPEDKEKRYLVWEMLEGEASWDSEFVESLLENNADTFRYLEQGLACPYSQFPEVTSLDIPGPAVHDCRSVASAVSLRTAGLMKAEEEAALEEAMKILEFGQRFQRSRGAMVHYLVGIAIKSIGLRTLRAMLAETSLGNAVLVTYIRELSAYRADREVMSDALRAEYVAHLGLIDNILVGGGGKKVRPGFLFRRNKTRRMFAEAFRVLIGNLDKRPAEFGEFKQDWPKKPGTQDYIRLFLSGNAVGTLAYNVTLPALETFPLRRCHEDLAVSATQLLIALKCYKDRTGKLPESLEALVPEYFDKVPEDPFDGKHMRYSREKKMIWSVGEDLRDSGGDLQDPSNSKEPTFKIEF